MRRAMRWGSRWSLMLVDELLGHGGRQGAAVVARDQAEQEIERLRAWTDLLGPIPLFDPELSMRQPGCVRIHPRRSVGRAVLDVRTRYRKTAGPEGVRGRCAGGHR